MGDRSIYLIFCLVLVVILAGCIIILIKNYQKLLNRNNALIETIDNLSRLNDKLRMDRHDYLNQLQIVYGLMELEEYDEMNSYLRKVYKELLKTGKAVKTSKPAINALLAAKSAEAEAKGIEFLIEVKSDLKNLNIEDWELCKVLSNIIDNAVKALEDSDVQEKKIRINITESQQQYIFSVENNGPEIPLEIRESIFKKGFTTKKEEGHGMGLAIVSEIVSKAKGKIELKSDEEETIFTVSFRKEE
ncbi:sensor histidine kinase [Butyrivibrio proteoclasticus]|uniref:sensor histidine kinase n=1 Tax=Butyrivibrio proteoclasticus TaxID=43305 RepID=UPI0006845C5D|nr:ATP-binding protein [Butyrivibrio proteoclasticus]